MKKGIILGVGALALVAVLAAILLMPAKPKSAVWKLSDGSELSLAGVTHGKNQTLRYGNRLADYLYPLLTPALRRKFNCQVAAAPGVATNSVTVWFLRKDNHPTPSLRATGSPFPNFRAQGDYAIVAVDENGMESASPLVGSWAWASGSNLLEAVTLPEFPRRSREIKLRIYNRVIPNGLGEMIGEFTIPNPISTNYPVWAGGISPVTIETNGLSVSVTKFEAGVSPAGNFEMNGRANSLTRAQVTVFSPHGPLEWQARSAQAKSATGESRYAIRLFDRPPAMPLMPPPMRVPLRPARNLPGSPVNPSNPTVMRLPSVDFARPRPAFPLAPPPPKDTLVASFSFPGTCWLQEPAWKIVVELERVTNFPPEEVWTISGVAIPKLGDINELGLKTNINGDTIEFLGLSAGNGNWGLTQTHAPHPPDHGIKVRSPIRTSNTHLQIAGIQDDQGRAVSFTPSWTDAVFTGSYSNNPALEQSFSLDIPLGAKTIDVKLAYPKSQFVEVLARPTKAGEDK